jgi:uroporphyrinogen decarboxylase
MVAKTEQMTKKERVRAALSGGDVDRVPASLWGHDFLREWTAGELVESTLDAWRPYEWDFIKFNPRATYFAEAWGNTYEPPTDQRQPKLLGTAVTSSEDLRTIRSVDATAGVLGEHIDALKMLVARVGDEVDVIHTLFSPLSVLAQLCGAPKDFIEMARSAPSDVHAALDAMTESFVRYAQASIAAGAAGIFFAPLIWASRDTSDDEFYRTFGRPYDLRVLDGAAGAPFNVLHVCRNNNMLEQLLDYPVAAFNWADHGEGNASLAAIRSKTQKAVMGGLDQARLHQMSADEVVAQGRAALAAGTTRVLLTAGCAINPETPPANRAAVMAAARGR